MTRPVFRDISLQFTTWNDPVQVVVRENDWISFKQGSTSYVLNLYFEGASQKDLNDAAAALRKLLPPSRPVVAEEAELDAAS